jgi:hypothetical protein
MWQPSNKFGAPPYLTKCGDRRVTIRYLSQVPNSSIKLTRCVCVCVCVCVVNIYIRICVDMCGLEKGICVCVVGGVGSIESPWIMKAPSFNLHVTNSLSHPRALS